MLDYESVERQILPETFTLAAYPSDKLAKFKSVLSFVYKVLLLEQGHATHVWETLAQN